MTTGINWLSGPSQNPIAGDCYLDQTTNSGYIWQGSSWVKFSGTPGWVPPVSVPTTEQLEKHPSLKQAWEEFLVIKRLLGV